MSSYCYLPRRYCHLINLLARPFHPPPQIKHLQTPYKPYRLTVSATGVAGNWSQKASVMSSPRSTDLPPGAWDSHVHVVDEVSGVI